MTKYQKLKAVYSAHGQVCPVSESDFLALPVEKAAKVDEILSRYEPEDNSLLVEPLKLKQNFGRIKLVDGSIGQFDSQVFDSSVIGKQLFITDGANDFSLAPDGFWRCADGTDFTIQDGKIKSISNNTNKIIKEPVLQNQGFSKEQIAMAKINDSKWQALAEKQKMNTLDINRAKEPAKELDATDKTILKFMEQKARQVEVEDKSEWFSGGEKRFMNPKEMAASAAAYEKKKQAEESAKFKAERDYIEQGITPKGKYSNARLDPQFEMYVFTATTPEGMDIEAGKILASQVKPEKIEEKKVTDEDMRFNKSKAFFAKPKKEISPELKARLIQMGYMRPE